MEDPNRPGNDFVKKQVAGPSAQMSVISGGINTPKVADGGFKSFYRSNKWYFLAIIAGVVIISLLGYYAFKKGPASTSKQANVAINIDVPQTVPSGGEAVYKITVTNNDAQKLVSMQLELAYPEGESYESSSPQAADLSGSLFSVPDLLPGQNAVVIVKTKITGNVGDQKTLDAKLHYSYGNFNSQFVKDQTSTIQLAASNIGLTLQGPTNTSNAQLVMYTITYQNNSGGDVQNARVEMDYPDGFVFAQSTPAPDLGSNTWVIPTLSKNASSTITVQGTFSAANPGENKTATANFLIQGPDGNYFTQNSTTFSTQISSLPLLVTQSLQAANTGNVVNPGQNLTFNITYQNNASVAATGVNVEVDLNTKVIDPASISSQGGQINNSTIIWNASGVPQLASLLPNQSGQLSFTLKVNNPATKDSSKNLTIISDIKIKSNEYSTAFPGNELALKVSSPSSVNTALTYVSGSLPPQVGKSTVYQVSVSLTNSSNDFSSGVFTAFIPAASFSQSGVSPDEAQNVQFDPATNKLTWNVGSLPANTGRFNQARILTFDLTLNPGATNANQPVVLLNKMNFSATDLFTNQPVSVAAPDLRTSDLQGQGGFSQGTVQP
ncbi:MAG: hypothetical protein P4L74_00445 [Candidatus Doudnabacteria bacterium]|nr:hypothetical protein [Candidatus Doudnabacteria bacterium]